MRIGKIIGTVTATRKDERLVGYKLLLTQPYVNGQAKGEPLVAVDTVGAGIGEIVLYATGSASRNAANKPQSPIDASIIGIIDSIDVVE